MPTEHSPNPFDHQQHIRLLATLEPLKRKAMAWKAWYESDQQEEEPEKPTIEEYRRITRLVRDIQDIRQGRAPLIEHETDEDMMELIHTLSSELQNHLTTRLSSSGSSETITIHPEHIRVPDTLTKEHLEAVKEALGGTGWEERLLPTLEDLNHLNEAYVNALYPSAQSEADTARGLTAHRPSWWNEKAKDWGFESFAEETTKGQAYLASMRHELKQLGGSLVLLDTATKPKYIDGSEHYGSTKGTDPTADPLLPLFQQAFGSTANRFSYTWDVIQTILLPIATQKIHDLFKAKSLPDIPFEVILTPALLDNLDMTFHHPASSSTETWEWTSTPLIDDTGADSGRRLTVGRFQNGGAGNVADGDRGRRQVVLGARLAVVFIDLTR